MEALSRKYPGVRAKLPPRRERRQHVRWLRKNIRIVLNMPGLTPASTGGTATYDEAGSQPFTTAGSHSFTIPNYSTTLTITLWGGGGSCYTGLGTPLAGGASTITSLSLSAGGGQPSVDGSTPGAGGTATGGDTNTNGNAGTTSGAPPPGGAGHNGYGSGANGVSPGKGYYPSGGGGAKVIKAYAQGVLTPGASLTIVVGDKGTTNSTDYGAGIGRVEISWT